MLLRTYQKTTLFAVIIAFFGVTVPLHAQAPKPTPGVVFRMQPINRLVENAFFLAEAVGMKEQAKMIEGSLKGLTGPKGIEGIDPEKPIGLYGNIGPNLIDSEVVGLIPIADEKTFVEMLGKLNLQAKKGENGNYVMNIPNSPFPMFFKFKDGYMCATIRDEKGIDDKKLLSPKELLSVEKTGVMSISLNLSGLPEDLIKNIVPQIELQIAEAKQKKIPGETPAVQKLRNDVSEMLLQFIVQVFTQGDDLTMKVDMDRKAGDIGLGVSFKGKNGSELAKTIAGMGAGKSMGAGMISKDSVLHMNMNSVIPATARKDFIKVFQEGINKSIEDEKDAGKKGIMEKMAKALAPTLELGTMDAVMEVRKTSNGKFAFLTAMKIAEGKKIEEVIKLLYKDLPDSEKKKLSLDFAKAGDTNVHKVDILVQPADVKNFGSEPGYLAISNDVILFAGGEKSLPLVNEALSSSAKPSPIFEFEIAFNKAAGLLTKEFADAVEVAEKIFKENPNSDKLKLTLEGGKELSLKMSMKSTVLTFFKAADGSK
ncbi:MAG: hypothetical protein JHC56_06455 [Gemmataceae bacterium]|nr:hypothetical protein [Gemmataceae bacterium]MBJ7497961.1 hypothetical protein [Gemmataceae bacterium]RLS56406.1 MAG: hypothetical protein DWH95_10200 [Planctomycetota bacterium]